MSSKNVVPAVSPDCGGVLEGLFQAVCGLYNVEGDDVVDIELRRGPPLFISSLRLRDGRR